MITFSFKYLLFATVCCFRGCIAQELYYSALRRKVLDSRCDQQEALFFQLAAAALQAEVGDAQERLVEEESEEDGKEIKKKTETKQNYFLPEDYFPSWVKTKVCCCCLRRL